MPLVEVSLLEQGFVDIVVHLQGCDRGERYAHINIYIYRVWGLVGWGRSSKWKNGDQMEKKQEYQLCKGFYGILSCRGRKVDPFVVV